MSKAIQKISIHGYKSIHRLDRLELHHLNILIGANGCGKSNFVNFLKLLYKITQQRLGYYINKHGGADAHLFKGPKTTPMITGVIEFEKAAWEFHLEPTADHRLIFKDEQIRFYQGQSFQIETIGSGNNESKLKHYVENGQFKQVASKIYTAMNASKFYHFHDTSATAAIKRRHSLRNNEYLHTDAGNLAAFLHRILQEDKPRYELIRDTIRLAAPFFDDFKLRPNNPPNGDTLIELEWRQRHTDFPFHSSQLSDGVLRFMGLAVALLQPDPPSIMIFDEPELGLHPEALEILAGLLKQATFRSQIIVATQSAALLNYFEPEDLIVIDRDKGASVFRRLASEELSEWLKDYTLSELWQKNIFEGGPVHE